MEFKDFFSTLKNRISNGYDVPEFFRDLFAMITDIPEENWGTKLDPATKKIKDDSLRSYAKRGIPKKFAQQIVYSLSPENYIESLNSRPVEARKLLADDFLSYDAEVTEDNVAEKTAKWFIEIIQTAAGMAPKSELEQQKQHQLAGEMKSKYGSYLLNEVNHFCPFPGCGRSLTKTNAGKAMDLYEISLIDRSKESDLSNLLALCPQCYATYCIDDSPKTCKALLGVKKILESHNHSLALLDDLPLEKGIVGVISRIKKLKETELAEASLDPKELKQKLKPADNFALYSQVSFFVMTYFVRIREIMINLDKRGEIDYEEVQDQMHAIYKGMIVYDLAVLFTTALPALAHDSLIFKNLEKDVEDGIMKIYASTPKQVFIAYDKQGDCRPETQKLLEDNCILRLSDNNCELYGRSWNKEE